MDNVIVAANLGAALLEQTGSRGNLITKAHVQSGIGEFCAAPAASAASTGTALLHAGNFVDATLLVVGSPLADLLAIFEMTGTHLRAVFPKPFPIPFRLSVNHGSLGPDTAVVVIFFDVVFLGF